MGTCPKCGNPVTRLLVEHMLGDTPSGNQWKCVSYVCPMCYAVLSAGIDPVLLKGNTIDEIVRALKEK